MPSNLSFFTFNRKEHKYFLHKYLWLSTSGHTQSLRLLFGQGARTRCPWGENLCATSSTFAGRRHMIGKVVTGCVAILPYHTATQDRGSECRDFGFISRIVTALISVDHYFWVIIQIMYSPANRVFSFSMQRRWYHPDHVHTMYNIQHFWHAMYFRCYYNYRIEENYNYTIMFYFLSPHVLLLFVF